MKARTRKKQAARWRQHLTRLGKRTYDRHDAAWTYRHVRVFRSENVRAFLGGTEVFIWDATWTYGGKSVGVPVAAFFTPSSAP